MSTSTMAPGAMYALDKRYVLVGSVADNNTTAIVAAVGDNMFETTSTAGKTVDAGPSAFVIDGSTGELKAVDSAALTATDVHEMIGCQWMTSIEVSAGPYTHVWMNEEGELAQASVNHRATALYGSSIAPVIYGTVIVAKEGVVR